MDKDKVLAALNKLDALLRTFHTIDPHDLQFQMAVLSHDIRSEVEKSPWIKVAPETMPEVGEKCWIATNGGYMTGAIWTQKGWGIVDDDWDSLFIVTHWMLIPKPPEESKRND